MRTKALALVLPAAFAFLALPGVAGAATVTVLHSFAGPEGETPAAPLVAEADGSLYGVAAHGGDLTVMSPDGGGTAFRLDVTGTLTTLHVFRGPEGAVPTGLIRGRDGFFYGTATYGGQPTISPLQPGYGTIFRMDAAGTVTVLHVFPPNDAGAFPRPVVQGSDGAIYGTVSGGVGSLGHFPGYVYRLDPVTGSFRHLHDFAISDGENPTGPLFEARDGFLYGTTNQGGAWNAGVVYKVDAAGSFALLHSLSPLWPGEGSEPKGGVIQASNGLFYGTTEQGTYGGEIFAMDAAGTFTVLHRFDAYASDGWKPVSGLIEGRDGFLYGTAPVGGLPVTGTRYGVVYRMDKAGGVTVLHTFTGPDGVRPTAALAQGADGALYGSTIVGGAFGLGVLFRIDLAAPAPAPAPPPALTGLTLQPSSVAGGQPSTGTVTLGGEAPSGGAVIALSSSDSSVVTVPSSVTVQAGARNATFVVWATRVKKAKTVTVRASYDGVAMSATWGVTR